MKGVAYSHVWCLLILIQPWTYHTLIRLAHLYMIILTSKVKNQECEGNVGVFDMPTLGLETGGLKTPSSV